MDMDVSPRKIGVQSVQRSTLSQQVVDRIVELLISGKVKAGDKLPPEMELMEELQVSRPVLREALSALETLGIITRRTREGTFFNDKIGTHPFSIMLSLSVDNIPAIFEARVALELGLVTIAAEKITDEQLRALEKTIDAIENSKDNNYGKDDIEFHRIIALSAKNPIVEGMIDSLLIMHNRIDSLIQKRDRDITLSHHRAIYNALKDHNPKEAFLQMYTHLNFVRQKVLKSLES